MKKPAMISVPSVFSEVHPQACPWFNATNNSTRPTINVSAPIESKRSPASAGESEGMNLQLRYSAVSPTGILIKNTACQENMCVNQPPNEGATVKPK